MIFGKKLPEDRNQLQSCHSRRSGAKWLHEWRQRPIDLL
ncbi:hypothetical protein RISK_000516 [Rhodopirellula islandica]|uniref:Uncharacterized protein n=1 Tax=Rhodopirellula islandica TaxID=595434 RepID=A0A0J1BLW0_RHOIS|nr:hypothetical protein RISK_000516 [Rhodopirellula islandica]